MARTLSAFLAHLDGLLADEPMSDDPTVSEPVSYARRVIRARVDDGWSDSTAAQDGMSAGATLTEAEALRIAAEERERLQRRFDYAYGRVPRPARLWLREQADR